MPTPVTKALIYAAATDAAVRNMRSAGRAVMSDEDRDAYQIEFDRIVAAIGGIDAWVDLPSK
jgi:hypothetical protein